MWTPTLFSKISRSDFTTDAGDTSSEPGTFLNYVKRRQPDHVFLRWEQYQQQQQQQRQQQQQVSFVFSYKQVGKIQIKIPVCESDFFIACVKDQAVIMVLLIQNIVSALKMSKNSKSFHQYGSQIWL